MARRAVAAEQRRLFDRFGERRVDSICVENTPDRYEAGLQLVEQYGMLADAGAVVRDDSDRLLLIRHPEGDGWGHPGGGYERDGSLAATARREVREETGVDVTITGLRYVREKTIVHAGDSSRTYPMLTAIFDAHGSGPATAGDDEEVLTARWFETLPTVLDSFTGCRGECHGA
ncbi:NUDIX hydrolase [Halosegnis rubeus]|uniref:NUDIX domain-containing protein n=1 Tax=Halosegnis rubeus TaxID=2212850 RepID=A0A5N5UA84_9EURY|nr:NUDIX hydrolase [Halosegnis rubeus]KAB7515533.1 NUDIX domain-containing protein [Halosegnis rubeus]